MLITSVHNPLIVDIRSLHRPKGRRAQGAFLIEGVRLVLDAIASVAPLRTVLVCPAMLGDGERTVRSALDILVAAPRIVTVSEQVMRSIAGTETPQGVLAVADLPSSDLPPLQTDTGLFLVLDGVRDPGNVGTLVRAGAAAGCDMVVTTGGSADPFAPKVVRAAMGAHFHLPVISALSWDILGPALSAVAAIYGADASATTAYDAVDWCAGSAIVIGHEDHGLGNDALAWCRETVAIPLARDVESLNAAVSGGIILFEAARQRRAAEKG